MLMRKRPSIRLVAVDIVVLVSFVCVQINTIVNGHMHRDAHGIFTFHAHPFQKSSSPTGENHHHNNFELLFYQVLNRFLGHGLMLTIVWQITLPLAFVRLCYISEKHVVLANPNHLSRAPPFQIIGNAFII